jgi:hypothetical protein
LDYLLLIVPLRIEGDRKELKDLGNDPEKDLGNDPEKDLGNEENLEIDGRE